MPRWTVYEFLDERLQSTVRAWLESENVQAGQVAVFREKIMALRRDGEMAPGLIEGPIKKVRKGDKTDITGIYKMKIRGNKGWVQLRPLLCHGPLPGDDAETTITILTGAVEKNFQLYPEDCLRRADKHREILKNDPSRRRILRIPRLGI